MDRERGIIQLEKYLDKYFKPEDLCDCSLYLCETSRGSKEPALS